jgi:hypothetical protein
VAGGIARRCATTAAHNCTAAETMNHTGIKKKQKKKRKKKDVTVTIKR